METKSNIKFKDSSSRFFLILCIVMVVAISAFGVLLSAKSVSDLKTVVWDNMESVATTAATLIDGDELKLITEADYPVIDEDTGVRIADGSERCMKIEQILIQVKDSQKNMFVPYIYITRLEDGHQVFVIDPDIDTPAKYGKEVVYTPSQKIAWAGQAKVDNNTYTDEWGTYYTAWSPIKDSDGRVVGLVGVDFEASQIRKELANSMIVVVSSTLILLALCIVSFSLYSSRVRKRSTQLGNEINDLSNDLKTMFNEIEGIEKDSTPEEPEEESTGQDFMKYVDTKTITMTQRLRKHMAYMKQQANIDFMTKTGNTRAYFAEKNKLQESINDGTADFAVVIFDINGLKKYNDSLGHERGDMLITAAADALKKTFANFNIYRIGGDEFAVIIPGAEEKSIELQLGLLDLELERINKTFEDNITLAIAKGYAIFNKETDKEYRDIFIRADGNMYLDKNNYHKEHGLELD